MSGTLLLGFHLKLLSINFELFDNLSITADNSEYKTNEELVTVRMRGPGNGPSFDFPSISWLYILLYVIFNCIFLYFRSNFCAKLYNSKMYFLSKFSLETFLSSNIDLFSANNTLFWTYVVVNDGKGYCVQIMQIFAYKNYFEALSRICRITQMYCCI